MKRFSKKEKRNRRHRRVRARISGTADCLRFSVFRSLRHISAQLIDDVRGTTLVAVSDGVSDGEGKGRGKKKERGVFLAEQAGLLLAKKAAKTGINRVVFDRGGYRYHGVVKALAEGARKGGLTF